MSDRVHRFLPEWANDAAHMFSAAGCRVTLFRLTERQARELEAVTGQRRTLFGVPIHVRSEDKAVCDALKHEWPEVSQ